MLEKKGVRLTVQRRKLLEYFLSNGGHPTVNDIYSDDKYRIYGNKATIYNNLKMLKVAGLIREIHIAKDSSHYELVNSPTHSHVICTECGLIKDFHVSLLQPLNDLNRSVKEQTGKIVTHLNLNFFGICPNCLKKDKTVQNQQIHKKYFKYKPMPRYNA